MGERTWLYKVVYRDRLERVAQPFQEFARRGVLGGILLVACALTGIIWANSPWSESYFHLWETPVGVVFAERNFNANLHLVINDALMVVFFVLVGLEIKRELLVGELSTRQSAALPIVAAAGGMLVPALLYLSTNASGPSSDGWGIPVATDIAFALGVLTILGPRVPVGLKVFLTALAIVDDIGAVLIIAMFYTSQLNVAALSVVGVVIVGLWLMGRLRINELSPYVIGGVILWAAMLASGVHATVAGVVLAFTIPATTVINSAAFLERAREILNDFHRSEGNPPTVLANRSQQETLHSLEIASVQVQAPLLRMEHRLHAVVTYFILPLFALSNSGVALSGGSSLGGPVTVGVALGLIVGKPVGIMLASWLAVKTGLSRLPSSSTWPQLFGVACLGGIGFTMSLFVANLAFPAGAMLDEAKVAVMGSSVVAGIIGWLLVRRATAPEEMPGDGPTG
jgi:Na+:H+ antiporter, NhaA family